MTKAIIRTGLGAIAFCVLALFLWFISLATNLPDVSRLKHYRPPAAAEVFDRTGQLVTSYHDRSLRFWVRVDDIPELVVWSVVIAEDDTFFAHQGVNYRATWDALVHDMKKGRFARGGSTITQQMIKNVLLSREKTIGRKVREYFLARKAEELLTKRKILEIYLNEVEWGEKLYGIEAASRYYFDKHVSELTLAEASLLAGMLPNPRYFNPYKRMDKAKERQERVLSNMLQAKIITEDLYRSAVSDPLTLRSERSGRFDSTATGGDRVRPCYQRVLEERFLETFGEDWLFREGTKIRTTLDKQMQDMLNAQEEINGNARERVPERIVIIREGIDIRAISCAANEDAVRTWAISPGIQTGERSVESIATGSLKPGDLLAGPAPAESRQD